TAFVQNYKGQTYYWRSESNGGEWTFVDRTLPTNGVVNSGFSDPEFAYDTAGNVYVSEINLANISMSKSGDSGRTYQEQNLFAQTVTDRQWTEGDEEDVVYIIANSFGGGTFPTDPAGNLGHFLYKSKDGGKTFTAGQADGAGLGDIRVDKSDGTLYETQYAGGELKMRAFRGARADNLEPEDNLIADGVAMLAHWPSFDLDPAGNLYVTWDESGNGDRAAGIYYSYSTDRGKSWATPVRLDKNENTDIWPWIAVGDEGRVAVAWFQADTTLPDQDAETKGDHGWTVEAAQSLNGLGCLSSTVPAFRNSTAVPEMIHAGTICQGGTTCQAMAIDRRLGDYFSIEIAGDGNLVLAYSDTRMGGPVALPGFTRQVDGPSYFGKPEPRTGGGGPVVAPAPTKPAPPKPAPPKPAPLPATGGTLAGVGVALLAAAVGVQMVRRRRLGAREA
ncbi:MAG TPA: sialidase family protein, partial [Mycobacteriales bacterium]|nr:sialidase family protein [Mycobacteriales bacterium]